MAEHLRLHKVFFIDLPRMIYDTYGATIASEMGHDLVTHWAVLNHKKRGVTALYSNY